jgi:hypothetical protein
VKNSRNMCLNVGWVHPLSLSRARVHYPGRNKPSYKLFLNTPWFTLDANWASEHESKTPKVIQPFDSAWPGLLS